ncbi:uncharacterized protein N7498_007872 [Penicillium cinerascens]|uniref:Uncharacterized protein n=1 Tax=Penicillium cinerascens TaxID=70096 RepID=A0A9W9JKP2_9EURO|nr:uncharacterized protein N7498_007872 [Penicillium cinerascens]KAJ5198755.1 hypothetical protein N7498_007872 [Penicillium cinerascens]
MQRNVFTDEEVQLASERRLKYLGTAKVRLNEIMFNPPLPEDLDPKNLERLREIFRKHRCRRLDIENHVPAIVSREGFEEALHKAHISAEDLSASSANTLPLLRFPAGELKGLHGRHRAQVGSEMLAPVDRWWIVDLYLNDICGNLLSSLIEEYANQKAPSDGEIYRKIRQYEGEQNNPFRQRWFVRLSKNNQERLDQLDNRRNRLLRAGFDKLLQIPGLWLHGLRISMLHRVIGCACTDEVLHYLVEHIFGSWFLFVGGDLMSLKKIGPDTVKCLQLLAPGSSKSDAKKARGAILSGEAFAEFSDQERAAILSRVEAFKPLIPSLYTFFEDFKYLESCSQCVKRLFEPSDKTMWESMSHMFSIAEDSNNGILIQTSEFSYRRQNAEDYDCLNMAYRQIWLYAMRHYPCMPADSKNDDELLAKPNRAKADVCAIYEMADLAKRLGFSSNKIDELTKELPDYQIARAALLQARKPNRFYYAESTLNDLIKKVANCFSAAVLIEETDNAYGSEPLLAVYSLNLKARCGMPQMKAHKQDSKRLFLDALHDPTSEEESPVNIAEGSVEETSDAEQQPTPNAGSLGLPIIVFPEKLDYERNATSDPGKSAEGESECLRADLIRTAQKAQEQINLRSLPSPTPRAHDSASLPGRTQFSMPQYLEGIEKADREQEILDENIARERLQQEFNLPDTHLSDAHASSPSGEQSDSNVLNINSDTLTVDKSTWRDYPITSLDSARLPEILAQSSSQEDQKEQYNSWKASTNAVISDPVGTSALSEVSLDFYSYERGRLKVVDHVKVHPSDTSRVEYIAQRYLMRDFGLYDNNLQGLSADQCYQAATVDGHNAILVLSTEEARALDTAAGKEALTNVLNGSIFEI